MAIRLLICFVVVIVTAALDGAATRVAQHRNTLFYSKKEQLPKWWPNEKQLNRIKIFFQWVFVLTTIVNCVMVTLDGNPLYIINAGIIIVAIWPIGRLCGIGIASAVIRIKGKKNNVRVVHECL